MSRGLLVVDVQNEFSPEGQRAVTDHQSAIDAIKRHVSRARAEGWPIAWVKHHNKPHESPAFVPGSWGAELSEGMGPDPTSAIERLFVKDVFSAFTYTGLEDWLRDVGVTDLLIVGFYAHMCVSTTSRDALGRGFEVTIDPKATGARDLDDPVLGHQSASEVRDSAFLHLINMGAGLAD